MRSSSKGLLGGLAWRRNDTSAISESAGGSTPTWDAHARTRRAASGGCAPVRGQPANGHDVGADARRGPAGMAARCVGSASECPGEGSRAFGQAAGAGRHGRRLSDRGVDAFAGSQRGQARVRPRLQHLARVDAAARDRVPPSATPDVGPRYPTRRAGDPQLEDQALGQSARISAGRDGRHHRLRRRIGAERATHPGEDLGTEGPNPGAVSTASTGSSSR